MFFGTKNNNGRQNKKTSLYFRNGGKSHARNWKGSKVSLALNCKKNKEIKTNKKINIVHLKMDPKRRFRILGTIIFRFHMFHVVDFLLGARGAVIFSETTHFWYRVFVLWEKKHLGKLTFGT